MYSRAVGHVYAANAFDVKNNTDKKAQRRSNLDILPTFFFSYTGILEKNHTIRQVKNPLILIFFHFAPIRHFGTGHIRHTQNNILYKPPVHTTPTNLRLCFHMPAPQSLGEVVSFHTTTQNPGLSFSCLKPNSTNYK